MTRELRDLIPLQEAARLLPTNPHPSTLHRWVSRGYRGHKLRVVNVGRNRCTTREWLMEFFAVLQGTEEAMPPDRKRRSTGSERKQLPSSSMAVLEEHGLGEAAS